MEIPLEYQISDKRGFRDFKKQTFCGYKKINVFKALIKSLQEKKIEEACNWSIEMIISGYIEEFWETCILFVCKNINIANIEVITYLKKRFINYLNLIEYSNLKEFKLKLRNNQQFRNIVCEIVCVLSLSRKMKLDTMKKVKKEQMVMAEIRKRIRANIIINKNIIKHNDPDEIKIVSNEFLSTLRNFDLPGSLFWLSWMLEWEKLNLKKLKVFKCAYRPLKNVSHEFAYDLIWLIWDTIIVEAKNRNSSSLTQINELFRFFKYDYKKSKKGKRIPYIICCIKLLFFNGHKEPTIISRYDILIQACNKINFLYRDKKEYENAGEENKKKEKFYSIYRDDYKTSIQNNKLIKKPKTKNPVKKPKLKKPRNISEHSYNKLQTVMALGGIIRKDGSSRKHNYYNIAPTKNDVKQINIVKSQHNTNSPIIIGKLNNSS